MSRAPRPMGSTPCALPAAKSASQTAGVSSGVQYTSKPSSPVYPVRDTRALLPATVMEAE